MNDNRPRYPDVHVKLSGQDGNMGGIIGRVMLALRRAGHGDQEEAFAEDLSSSESHDDALQRVMRWVDVS